MRLSHALSFILQVYKSPRFITMVFLILILVFTNYVLADVGYVCKPGPMIAEGVLWTPIILLNSPYAGYAGAKSLAYTATYIFNSGPTTLISEVFSQVPAAIYASMVRQSASLGLMYGLFIVQEW